MLIDNDFHSRQFYNNKLTVVSQFNDRTQHTENGKGVCQYIMALFYLHTDYCQSKPPDVIKLGRKEFRDS